MFKNNDYSKVIAVNITILSIIWIFYILIVGSSLILPFVISLLMSFWIISVSGFFYNLWMNKFFSYFSSMISFIVFFFILWWIINTNISEITKPENIDFYQNRLETLSSTTFEYFSRFNINEESLKQKFIKSIDFSSIFGSVTSAITSIVSNAWLIIIYILFILLEYRFFKDKIWLMTSNPLRRANINSVILKIKDDVKAYFLIKTITSFFTWLLSYFALLSFGVDFALFWSFSIFILNFIPTVGSISAVFIVSIFAVIQFWFNAGLFALVSILTFIQIFIWNVIEPRLMWNKLNLSPLVILLSLWLWWSIWWVIWMLLSVPIMVIINIVLSKFDSTKGISILLSEKWIVESPEEVTMEKTRKKLYKLLKDKFYNNNNSK